MCWKTERDMFLQRALRASLALVVAGGLANLFPAVISTARSETAQETAVGPDALDALARMGKTPTRSDRAPQDTPLILAGKMYTELLPDVSSTCSSRNPI
jgi:hypothetical protein